MYAPTPAITATNSSASHLLTLGRELSLDLLLPVRLLAGVLLVGFLTAIVSFIPFMVNIYHLSYALIVYTQAFC
jgi:hypothetical protein